MLLLNCVTLHWIHKIQQIKSILQHFANNLEILEAVALDAVLICGEWRDDEETRETCTVYAHGEKPGFSNCQNSRVKPYNSGLQNSGKPLFNGKSWMINFAFKGL